MIQTKPLYALLQDGASIQKMVDACSSVFHQRIQIKDSLEKEIYVSKAPEASAGDVVAEECGTRYPLYYKSVEIGQLWFPDLQEPSHEESEAAEEIQNILSLCAYMHGWGMTKSSSSDLLTSLFAKSYITKVELKEILQKAGLFGIGDYRLIFMMAEKEQITSGMLSLFQATLAHLRMPVAFCLYDDIPIILTEGYTAVHSSSDLYLALLQFARQHSVHVFVSGRFSEIIQAKDKLRHCEFLMKCITDVSSPVIMMDRFNMFDLLLASDLGNTRLKSICSETLLSIKQYDDENGTEYLRTLRTYLVYNRNPKETGATLCIHPNTVLYRIHTMQNRFSFDLNDTITVFSFTISLYIMIFLGIHDPI